MGDVVYSFFRFRNVVLYQLHEFLHIWTGLVTQQGGEPQVTMSLRGAERRGNTVVYGPAIKFVILSDQRESKDLRTSGNAAVESVRRSFGALRLLRMTDSVVGPSVLRGGQRNGSGD